MSEIKLHHICKSFDKKQVLQDVNLSISIGETTAITGKSGCGKTTLLSILMGILKADSGTIEGLDGQKISAVFQEERLVESLTVLKNIQLVCRHNKKISEIEKLLQELELEDCLDKKVAELSGGMKRRVSIARALCVPFDILFLDEALKGLDAETKVSVIKVIKEHTKGKTVICITHDFDEVCKLNGRQILLD